MTCFGEYGGNESNTCYFQVESVTFQCETENVLFYGQETRDSPRPMGNSKWEILNVYGF